MKRNFTKVADSPRVYIYVGKDKCLYRVKSTTVPKSARTNAADADLVDISIPTFFAEMNTRIKKSSDVPMLLLAVIVVTGLFALIARSVSAASAGSGGAAFPQISWGIALFVLLAGLYGVRHVYKTERAERRSEFFYKLSDDTEQELNNLSKALLALSKAERIWRVDTPAAEPKSKVGTSSAVARTLVEFGLKPAPYVMANLSAYCLNLAGMLIFFFPDQLLLFDVEHKRYETVRYNHITVDFALTPFIEEQDAPPKDAKIKRYASKRARKDPAIPDKQPADNRKFPVLEYGSLKLVSSGSMNVSLMISNAESAQQFAQALASFKKYHAQSKQWEPPKYHTSSERPRRDPPPVSLSEDPYITLKVRANASWSEISAAYRQQAQMYHPDKVASLGPEFQDLANLRMKKINSAYEELKRRHRR